MIQSYYRPKSIQEALEYLKKPASVPIGGGSSFHNLENDALAIVDLQSLGLNKIVHTQQMIQIGATTKLQELADSTIVDAGLQLAASKEKNSNLRNQSTVAGTLVCSNGRSSLTAALLAADAKLVIEPGHRMISMSDWLPERKSSSGIITEIQIPSVAMIDYSFVGRTPEDIPLILLAAGSWPSGRIRLVLGGNGQQVLLIADTVYNENFLDIVRNSARQYFEEKSNHEYFENCAVELASRFISKIIRKGI
jgi:CO/xanthine dehydrogenase FAD-binding subunit